MMTIKQAQRIVKKFEGRRILVVGDLMLDRYVVGNVNRISPEAPVPVLESMHRHAVPGGAANVAANLAALGCEVTLCGVVGQDARGDELLRLLEVHGIDHVGVLRDGTRPTTHKMRVVAHQQQIVRIDDETTRDVDNAIVRAVLEKVHNADVDGIVFNIDVI